MPSMSQKAIKMERKTKKINKTPVQMLGFAGVVSFLSYACAVVFSPLAYPGYDWLSQAVSDLSAANAPSLGLWNSLTALYNVCEVLCATVVCIAIQGKKTKILRIGTYLFAAMEWVSAIGYRAFPLSDSGFAGEAQDVMHMVVTVAVVLLSIASLVTIIVSGAKDKTCLSYCVCASVALAMMLVGALGMKIVPPEYFGVVERFSVFAATGFNCALGLHLFIDKAFDSKTGETMKTNNLTIRNEQSLDYRQVENLTREAFWNVYRPGCTEHYVLHCLRQDLDFVPALDYVMELDGKLIGQVVYVRSHIDCTDGRKVPIMTFGPISVAPEFKRKGYGKILLDYTMQKAKEEGAGALAITGNIDFYGKSGFVPAKTKGVRYADDPDADYFLIKELQPGFLDGIEGTYSDPQGYFVSEKNPEDFDAYEATFPKKEKLVLPGQLG